NYLEQRKLELENEGGEDSKAYLRERQIILEVIETYKLQVETEQDVLEATLHESPLNSLPPISSNKSESQLNHLPSSNKSELITLQTNSVNGSKSQLLAELQQLAEFKREGILSEEEFQQAKKRLLNG
ncbi:SHOCT domain-containing protein, partial [Crocosphaera sp.]|uniref:SHOCT domain-containing protein n=1 Tax=Crocosphaera sp. TaxID=2729996 RepID=UPI00257CFCC2